MATVTLSTLVENAYHHTKQTGNPSWAREIWRVWRRSIEPVIGDIPADQLTTKVQMAYREARTAKGRKPATINRELTILRRCYTIGAKLTEPALIERIPHFIIAEEDNARKMFIPLDALDRLRQAAADHSHWMRAAVELAFVFGWRRGEICALRVCDVDLFDGTVRLQTSKNGDPREAPLTPVLRKLLAPAMEGRGDEETIVPVKPWMFGLHFNRVKAAAGCGKYRFHDYRRTSAKAKRAAGVPTSVIMELQGWKTEAMFRRYAIVDRGDKVAALKAQEEWEKQRKEGAA